jgi:hypothetical protein
MNIIQVDYKEDSICSPRLKKLIFRAVLKGEKQIQYKLSGIDNSFSIVTHLNKLGYSTEIKGGRLYVRW